MAGYIGPAPVPQATQNREAFTATGGQTTFATSGYKPGYLDVYLNGVKLAAADYTATNGSDVVLASGAAASDILEIVAFQEFTVADQTFTGDITFTGASYDAVWDASDNALEFGDNAKATFGASADLQIYHDGSHSWIKEEGTGSLIVRATDFYLQSGVTGESYISALLNGAVTLHHDDLPKLATTSTGCDLTGTLTADGLTVDGTASIDGASGIPLTLDVDAGANTNLQFNEGSALRWYLRSVTGSNDFNFYGNGASRLNISSGGDISFYNTSGNAKLFWDASAESLGIGTSSPQGAAHVKGETAALGVDDYPQLTIETAATSGAANTGGGILFLNHDGTGGSFGGSIQSLKENGTSGNSAHYMRFSTRANGGNVTERMRIDSSGNLLVGKTAADGATDGGEIRAGGTLVNTTNNSTTAYFNRRTSDGDLISFQKDGTTVGSIGVSASDDFYIGASTASHAGVYFGTDIVYPMRANSLSDGVTSIGHSSNRFNNLYLSGGVYLGGTGAANLLDDYEEGSWTPYLGGTSSDPTITYTAQTGKYVKVGTMVTLHGQISWTAKTGGAGFLRLAGFPFNGDHAGTEPAVNFNFTTGFGSTSAPVQGGVVNSTNWAYVYKHASSDARDNINSGLQTGDLGSTGALYFTITYRSV